MRKRRFILAGIFLALWLPRADAQTATVTIQANQPAATISSNLFGIFFEEINMAGDGGIYAELIRNRSFEDAATPTQWSLVTNGTAAGSFAIDTSLPLSATNTQSLKLTKTSGTGSIGAANNGYYGIALTNGVTCHLGFYARAASGFSGSIAVSLESTNGSMIYAQSSVNGLAASWQHFTLPLIPNATDANARLVLRISQAGSVYLDFISLFPATTFNNRTNGLRPDLANMLVNLKPSFMRFPGGSWVDGTDLADAYHWKLTIGDPANRVPRNNVWGYMVDNGLGYHEYLQLCEDLHTAPLLCLNCGMSGSESIPTNNLGPWVQEALDAIQYANGDTNTFWGAQRAANGHPAPFNLQYVEVGNENSGAAYNANYAPFYHAIAAAYPGMNIIADSFGTIPTTAPVQMLDEHYYNSAAWFAQNSTHYDSYSRSGPKIFVGEYAVAYNIGPGFAATLQNAIGEAAWMTGLERNADLVAMACYAPLFANVNNQNWSPNLIYFNGVRGYGTPSYYVQQMFSDNRGEVVLPTIITTSGNPLYVSSSLVSSSGQIIVKAVNFNNSTVSATFKVNGVNAISQSATVIQLSGNTGDTNSLATPTHIFPVTNSIVVASTNFTVTLPANSLSIFRLQGNGFNSATNLQLQFQPTLAVGQEAPTMVTGSISGQNINLAGNYAVTYSSVNSSVALVTGDGLVIGVGQGTTIITAAYNGLTATQSVTVSTASPTRLIHRYSFNTGTANDSIGAANGTFYNASGRATIANDQLNLTGAAGDYVDLGPAIVTTTNLTTGAVTFEAWATFNPANGAWARLFDFGNISGTSGGDYIFFAPNNAANGGSARLAVTDTMPGSSSETGFTLNNLLGQTNVHLTVVFNPEPTRQFLGLYVNGTLAASVPTGGKYIASINDAFSFLGHSLWSGDAWLNGSINEFRIYDGELDKFQIAASDQAGPDQTNYNAGTLTNLTLNAGALPLILNGSSQLTAYANFTLASNINVLGDANLRLSSDNSGVFTVSPSGFIIATGIGTANLIGVYNYLTADTSTFFTNVIPITVTASPPPVLTHRYSFTADTSDAIGGAAWNGTLPNGGTFANGQLSLASANAQYVQLPAGILNNYSAVTIESWVTFPNVLPVNCFFYGFGNTDGGGSGEDYIFCAPQGGRIAITAVDPGYTGEQNASGTGDLSQQNHLHLVAVYNPPAGQLACYTNGVLAALNNSVTVAMSSVSSLLNYIGRSLYNSDPYPDLTLDEFRIYNGALQTNEIAATQALGPDEVLSSASPILQASAHAGYLTLSWPLTADSFTLMARTNLLAGGWISAMSAPQISNNQWQVIIPITGNTQFFRLQR
ncbi:MAG TPA: alpha-L-arabinofuranosidase C-terminal domain-containing protein [Verrucomicrobiae bacterium]|jgi:alpha-L-arabinofuranosidase